MQLKCSYYYFISAIPPETCRRIIDLGTSRIAEEKAAGKSVEAYTFGEMQKGARGPDAAPQGELSKQALKTMGVEKTYVRDSEVTWLNDQWIYDLIHPFIQRANLEAGWNWEWDHSEAFQFTVYNPGGFYSFHKDGASDRAGAYKRYIHGVTPIPMKPNGNLPEGYVTDPNFVGKIRKISMTLNLNEPGAYEGGNLKFDFGYHTDGEQFHECEEIRPQGSIVVFPSFVDHTITPITSGTRYSLVLWCLGKPFR
jgi:PKHD-type hydroxylase